MAKVNFHAGTHAEFAAKLAQSQIVAEDLYFLTDAPQQLYRGTKLATETFVTYANDAGKPEISTWVEGVVYINLETGKMSIMQMVDPDQEGEQPAAPTEVVIATARVSAIAAAGDNDIPTVKAVKDYVAAHATEGALTSATYNNDSNAHKLVFQKQGAAAVEVPLPDAVASVNYDNATGTFTFTNIKGEVKTVNTPLEKMIKDVQFEQESKQLSITFYVTNAEGTEEEKTVRTTLDGLVSEVTVEATAEQAITVQKTTEGTTKFTVGLKLADLSLAQNASGLKVKISGNAGNALTLDDQGLFVATPNLSSYATTEAMNGAIEAAKAAIKADFAAAGGANLIGVSAEAGYGEGNNTVEKVLKAHQDALTQAKSDIGGVKTRLDTAENDINALETAMDALDNESTGRVTLLEKQLTWQTI